MEVTGFFCAVLVSETIIMKANKPETNLSAVRNLYEAA